MATWTNEPTATLKVRKKDSGSDTYTFLGVNSSNSAGTPEQFLAAVNHILNFGNQEAVLTGMTRTVKQGVNT